MKIDKDRMERYLQRIDAPFCPLCGHNQWTITGEVFQALEYAENSSNLTGETFPIVPISCTHCGNTYFVNAIIAGFIDRKADGGEADE